MPCRPRGFTLIELMVAVVIIGVLAAIAIPNYLALRDRAKEGSTKTNMHTLQVAAEDYGAQNDGACASTAATVVGLLPAGGANLKNPFNGLAGDGNAWKDVATWASPLATGSTQDGILAYSDSSNARYLIVARGKSADLPLQLTSGR